MSDDFGDLTVNKGFNTCSLSAIVESILRHVSDSPFMSAQSSTRLSLSVTVLLERRMISRSFWSMPSWYLHAVAVGDNVAVGDSSASPASPAGTSENGDLFAWPGHKVTLYKDACERYWHALIGEKPLVYVVCRDDSDDVDDAAGASVAVSPVIVTIDYDEATASAETDALVLSRPIPPELYRYMEAFVLQHYKPVEFKKRKRRNWSDEPGQSAATDHRKG